MLRVSGLTFGFRRTPLFSGVSFDVMPGELVHLTGGNGVGKSTLLAIVSGLLRPSAGTVEYWPGAFAAAPADDRRQFLDYLPAEANGLHLKMDAVQNLEFWAALRGVALTKAMTTIALGRVGLDHPLLRQRFPVEKYSTGMKRRLALARLALSPAPGWVLDEPVSGLDSDGLALFRDLVGEHLKRGGLALVVSHDLLAIQGIPGARPNAVRSLDLRLQDQSVTRGATL